MEAATTTASSTACRAASSVATVATGPESAHRIGETMALLQEPQGQRAPKEHGRRLRCRVHRRIRLQAPRGETAVRRYGAPTSPGWWRTPPRNAGSGLAAPSGAVGVQEEVPAVAHTQRPGAPGHPPTNRSRYGHGKPSPAPCHNTPRGLLRANTTWGLELLFERPTTDGDVCRMTEAFPLIVRAYAVGQAIIASFGTEEDRTVVQG